MNDNKLMSPFQPGRVPTQLDTLHVKLWLRGLQIPVENLEMCGNASGFVETAPRTPWCIG